MIVYCLRLVKKYKLIEKFDNYRVDRKEREREREREMEVQHKDKNRPYTDRVSFRGGPMRPPLEN